MTFQTAAPLTHRSLGASNRQAREIANMAIRGDLDVNPPYQRGSVWTHAQRLGLIRSWCLGVPIPAIMLNDRDSYDWRHATGTTPADIGEPSCVVIDGRQRVETAVAWFSGELAAPASWFEADAVETAVDTDDGPCVTYPGLTMTAQRHFSNRAALPVIEANAVSVAEEADLYLLINGAGTPHTDDEMDHAASYASEM